MSQQTLLIVHKDDAIRRDMHDIVAHFNFKIIYTDNGLQAMHALQHCPNLIISQVEVPMINGLQFGEKIREQKTIRKTPIIYLHNEINLKYIKKARDLGAKAFLINPYLDNTLIYAIKRALGTKNLNSVEGHDMVKYEDCLLSKPTEKKSYA